MKACSVNLFLVCKMIDTYYFINKFCFIIKIYSMGLASSRQEAFWEACGFGHVDRAEKFLQDGDINVNWVSYAVSTSICKHTRCDIHSRQVHGSYI